MKKSMLLFVFAMAATLGANAASMYKVDDASVEAAFSLATPMTVGISDLASAVSNPLGIQATNAGGKSAILAIVLDFFLGGIAIHRVYLGGTPVLILGYLVTFGGIFGLVPLIDLIVLAVNANDISKYENNNKFFMW